eukprot:GGOE01026161.1.p2 GENE.GGOE01026161.1~~GGOE01026161.1.p2  ORF type:complete len:316 (-),score=142.28 GGOE01026161.1:220-1125(-)
MAGGSKGVKAQAPSSPVVKIGAAMILIIIVLACMAIANGAKKKTQRNTSTRLELTRKRFEMCDIERRMLSGEKVSATNEVQMAQDEYSTLKSENELLKEDNNELSQDIAELERFVDDLREELDDKDFISDDEAQALEETLALGNNSKALAELLESASFSEETDIVVGKDQLIGLLLSELKLKRTSLAQCMAEKRVVGKFEGQMLWEEMNDQQRSALLRSQVKKIALLQQTNPTEAEALLQKWGPKHYRGVAGMRDDVTKRTATKASRPRGGRNQPGAAAPPAPEQDTGDDQWNEWDWDADN